MNFVEEINAFERWLETNHLPANSQLLWYKLFMLNNRAGWVEWLQVDNRRLMSLIQAGSENTFLRARDRLIEAGLLSFKKGKKGYPNKYHLHSFCVCTAKNEVQMEVQTEVEAKVNPAVNTEVEAADIDKLNQTKPNKKDAKASMAGAETAPALPTVITLTLNDKTEYPITQKQVDDWAGLYPAVNITAELRKMRGWLEGNPTKRKTKNGILRFVHRWLAKTQDMGGDNSGGSGGPNQATGVPAGNTGGDRPALGVVLE